MALYRWGKTLDVQLKQQNKDACVTSASLKEIYMSSQKQVYRRFVRMNLTFNEASVFLNNSIGSRVGNFLSSLWVLYMCTKSKGPGLYFRPKASYALEIPGN